MFYLATIKNKEPPVSIAWSWIVLHGSQWCVKHI